MELIDNEKCKKYGFFLRDIDLFLLLDSIVLGYVNLVNEIGWVEFEVIVFIILE